MFNYIEEIYNFIYNSSYVLSMFLFILLYKDLNKNLFNKRNFFYYLLYNIIFIILFWILYYFFVFIIFLYLKALFLFLLVYISILNSFFKLIFDIILFFFYTPLYFLGFLKYICDYFYVTSFVYFWKFINLYIYIVYSFFNFIFYIFAFNYNFYVKGQVINLLRLLYDYINFVIWLMPVALLLFLFLKFIASFISFYCKSDEYKHFYEANFTINYTFFKFIYAINTYIIKSNLYTGSILKFVIIFILHLHVFPLVFIFLFISLFFYLFFMSIYFFILITSNFVYSFLYNIYNNLILFLNNILSNIDFYLEYIFNSLNDNKYIYWCLFPFFIFIFILFFFSVLIYFFILLFFYFILFFFFNKVRSFILNITKIIFYYPMWFFFLLGDFLLNYYILFNFLFKIVYNFILFILDILYFIYFIFKSLILTFIYMFFQLPYQVYSDYFYLNDDVDLERSFENKKLDYRYIKSLLFDLIFKKLEDVFYFFIFLLLNFLIWSKITLLNLILLLFYFSIRFIFGKNGLYLIFISLMNVLSKFPYLYYKFNKPVKIMFYFFAVKEIYIIDYLKKKYFFFRLKIYNYLMPFIYNLFLFFYFIYNLLFFIIFIYLILIYVIEYSFFINYILLYIKFFIIAYILRFFLIYIFNKFLVILNYELNFEDAELTYLLNLFLRLIIKIINFFLKFE